MQHKVDVAFPDTKISEAFLKFAEPILGQEADAPTPQEVENALGFAFVVWNAVVYDTVNGNTEWVTRVRQQFAGQGPLQALVEDLIVRKQTQFGHDLRLVGEYKLIQKDGEWRLRAEARAPTVK